MAKDTLYPIGVYRAAEDGRRHMPLGLLAIPAGNMSFFICCSSRLSVFSRGPAADQQRRILLSARAMALPTIRLNSFLQASSPFALKPPPKFLQFWKSPFCLLTGLSAGILFCPVRRPSPPNTS